VRSRSELVHSLEATGLGYQCLESGSAWLLAAPELGARILGAGLGEENAFWVHPRPSRLGWTEGGNAGGQRSWLAPEGGPGGFFFGRDVGAWEVPPELDPGAYRQIASDGASLSYATELRARSAGGELYPLRLTRRIEIVRGGELPTSASLLHIGFRHELGNLGSSSLDGRVGLWSILQLPVEEPGLILFGMRAAGRGDRQPLLPYFVPLPQGLAGSSGRLAWLKVAGGERYKVGLPSRDCSGTIAFLRRERGSDGKGRSYILSAQKFGVDPEARYLDKASHSGPGAAPNGDAAQAYSDPGRGEFAFCEIEAHSPAPHLEPGESFAADISILVARLDKEELDPFLAEKLGLDPLPAALLPV
jgi:hypothetical protein